MSTVKDIYSISPPFLILFKDGSWRVAKEIFPHDRGLGYIEPYAPESDRGPDPVVLSGSPWSTKDGVWELDFGTRIYTLNQPGLYKHPGWSLWTHWLRHIVESAHETFH